MEFKGHINYYSYTSSSATKRDGKNFQVDISDFLNVISGCMEEESLQDHVRRRHYNNNNKEKKVPTALHIVYFHSKCWRLLSANILYFFFLHTHIYIYIKNNNIYKEDDECRVCCCWCCSLPTLMMIWWVPFSARAFIGTPLTFFSFFSLARLPSASLRSDLTHAYCLWAAGHQRLLIYMAILDCFLIHVGSSHDPCLFIFIPYKNGVWF